MFSDSVHLFLSECHRNFVEIELGLKDLDLESEGVCGGEDLGREDLVSFLLV